MGVRDYCFILLVYRYGMCISELFDLYYQDFDFNEGRINIRRLKNGFFIVYLLCFDECEVVECWIQECVNWKGVDWIDVIFIFRCGSRFFRQQVYRIICDVGIEVGIVMQIYFYMLRYVCGYELVECGVDIRLIQDYFGYRNIRYIVCYIVSNVVRFVGLWERNNFINEKLKREEV